ncbi:probable ATP-dependent DNA helicase HFM1 isoform X2 [Dysidea avara]|uniref:probable ATP-dependent DNA helicase HFM1 isoform X2 n=1 Tax=Dysidea avara TaxID=196820 RepID=UPI003327EE32
METSALVPPAPDPNDLFDDIFYNFSPVSSNLSARGPLFDTTKTKANSYVVGNYFDGSLVNSESAGEDDVLEESVRSPSFITHDGQYDTAEYESYYADSPKLQSYQQGYHQDHDQFSSDGVSRLRSVKEIPEEYRRVFSGYSSFNVVQSQAFDHVLHSDKHIVTSAPTGSGKTAIFEMAIIRLLTQSKSSFKIVYVAPIKALCTERYTDWNGKFGPLGLTCCELTGDTEMDDYFELQRAHIITTTPEKWDSMTRRWRDNQSLVQQVRLFFIDEVHQLNDECRGPTVEAIVSRMKTVRVSLQQREGVTGQKQITSIPLRFIAVSATIPNIKDIAAWLGTEQDPAVSIRYILCVRLVMLLYLLLHSIDDSNRPVKLHKVVLGYPESASSFKFDMSLNYRLAGVIQSFSDNKPTLVFCSTRKATQQAATTLVKDARFVMGPQHRQRLQLAANSIRENKLREVVMCGVGYHHAGLDTADRKMLETMFLSAELPVLFCTSTLAMGVNFPAHLVVIKSTQQYVGGMFTEYSETQVLQMIGRAGRPQFDTTATVVIMTRNATKSKYEVLLTGAQVIESNLHKNLIEHLNAEIVLHTITSVPIALEWIKSTFLYIRIKQNPSHYGKDIPAELSKQQLEDKLQEMCLRDLTLLSSDMLITMTEDQLAPTDIGSMMARYCVAYQSMRRFLQLGGDKTLGHLVTELSCCEEFKDIYLRVNEKKTLNGLNKNKTKQTVLYPMDGKIKSTDMKVNCLIQAALGCLPLHDFALNQDTQKIFRFAARLSRCMMELQWRNGKYQTLLGAVLLYKSIQCKLWENSKHVAKQLDKIGPTLSNALVNAGMISFEKIASTNPRELELIVNRHPPFGNQLQDAAAAVPHYVVSIQQCPGLSRHRAELQVTITCSNSGAMATGNSPRRWCVLIVGDSSNNVVYKHRVSSESFSEGLLMRKMEVFHSARSSAELKFHWISLDYVGVDVKNVFTPSYENDNISNKENYSGAVEDFVEVRSQKARIAHPKSTATNPPANPSATPQRKRKLFKDKSDTQMDSYLSQLHSRTDATPSATPAKRFKLTSDTATSSTTSLTDRFSYLPPSKVRLPPAQQATPKFKHLSATPSKFQQSTSTFPMSLAKPQQAAAVPPTKSKPFTPLNLKPSSQATYYHEVDSEFLDFDLWSPSLPESMLTQMSPPHNNRITTVAVTSPQASSSHILKPLLHNAQRTTSKTVISTLERCNDSIQSAKGRESLPPKTLDSGLCSFFTAGSVNSQDDDDNFSTVFNGIF